MTANVFSMVPTANFIRKRRHSAPTSTGQVNKPVKKCEVFMETTHLHGFSFIKEATYKWEIWLWIVVMIASGLGLAIGLTDTIIQYNDQPLSSNV